MDLCSREDKFRILHWKSIVDECISYGKNAFFIVKVLELNVFRWKKIQILYGKNIVAVCTIFLWKNNPNFTL